MTGDEGPTRTYGSELKGGDLLPNHPDDLRECHAV